MPGDVHKVSVIIPTLGRATLDRCQAALARQTRPADEIIVVMDQKRKGVSWARNEGIRRAKGDLIAITEDDCEPPPDWLERLIHAVDAYAAAGAGGPIQETDPLLDAIRRRRRLPSLEQLDTVGIVGSGGNILYRRAWLEQCAAQDSHIFDETIPTGEDWELVWRLRRRGAQLVFVPNPVKHLRRALARVYLHHQFDRGVGIAHLFQLHQTTDTPMAAQDSLLWGRGGQKTRANWLEAIWYKVIGPFDKQNFSSWREFFLFWLGEKFQGAGFLWGLIRLRYLSPPSGLE